MIELHHGNCLDILPTLEAGSVDAVITDPPWNQGYFKDDAKPWPEYINWLSLLRDEALRVSSGGVWIFQSTHAIPYVAHLFKEWQVFAALKNFSQMRKSYVPNCWDIVFFKIKRGYKANGRNYHIGNTAGMTRKRTGHPTQRPLDTMKYIIKMFDWSVILDPFMGSGTTGVACVETGRSFIGIELDAGYFEIARQRIEKAQSEYHQDTMDF